MVDTPIGWWDALLPFVVFARLAAVAGWLRGSQPLSLRTAGSLFLALIVIVSVLNSLITSRLGIMSDSTCIDMIDGRMTWAAVIALNAAVLLSARVARRKAGARASNPEVGSLRDSK